MIKFLICLVLAVGFFVLFQMGLKLFGSLMVFLMCIVGAWAAAKAVME